MPNRIIKESWRTSPTIDQLSFEAECLCVRLLTAADDFGRFLADSSIVLAQTFPMRIGRMSPHQIAHLLEEIAQTGMIRLYRVGDREYGEFVKFDSHNKKRATSSKYPGPDKGVLLKSADTCEQMPADANMCGPIREARSETTRLREARNENAHSGNPRAKPSGNPRAIPPLDEPPGFAEWYAEFPRKVSKQDAIKAWFQVKPPMPEALYALRRCKQTQQWQETKSIPYPATWLRARRWEDEGDPIDTGPTQSRHSPTQGTRADEGIRKLLARRRGAGDLATTGGGVPGADPDHGADARGVPGAPHGLPAGNARPSLRVLDPHREILAEGGRAPGAGGSVRETAADEEAAGVAGVHSDEHAPHRASGPRKDQQSPRTEQRRLDTG